MGFGDVVAMAIAFGRPTLVAPYVVNATPGRRSAALCRPPRANDS